MLNPFIYPVADTPSGIPFVGEALGSASFGSFTSSGNAGQLVGGGDLLPISFSFGALALSTAKIPVAGDWSYSALVGPIQFIGGPNTGNPAEFGSAGFIFFKDTASSIMALGGVRQDTSSRHLFIHSFRLVDNAIRLYSSGGSRSGVYAGDLYIHLERIGSSISSYWSLDGINRNLIFNSTHPNLAIDGYVALFVSDGGTGEQVAVDFSNIVSA